ncbi:MAG: ATP-dependent RNA helicase [Vicinamibacterales bacterium]
MATRIAAERNWTMGQEVGWQIRFEHRASRETRILVVTEGILTVRFQSDPLLLDFATVVIDEFHERSIHADLAIALAKQAWLARDDLRLVVMSATLDAAPVSAFLGGCPIVDVPGRSFPVSIAYEPSSRVTDAALTLATQNTGDVLCFLPGAADIHRTIADMRARLSGRGPLILPLYGGLDGASQDRALSPASDHRARIVVATNIAETSLTVPGVRNVVDTGWAKVARYDAARGIDSLDLERVTQDGADQRAGRAGREGPGRVVRLWERHDRLRPHREPDIQRIDLASVVLDIMAWGGRPDAFDWFQPPSAERLDAAVGLLTRLSAVRNGRLTDLGRAMQRLPLHPRLSRMLLEADGHPAMARACALLSERRLEAIPRRATNSDLLSALDDWGQASPHVIDVADHIARLLPRAAAGKRDPLDERVFRRAVLAGYPDRVGRRREQGAARVKLASGTGAVLAPDSGVVDAEFLVAVDLRAVVPGRHGVRAKQAAADGAVIAIASRVEREWLIPTHRTTEHWVEKDGQVRARMSERYDALVLAEHPAEVDLDVAADLLAQAWLERGPDEADARLLRRLKCAGIEVNLREHIRSAARGRRRLADVHLSSTLDATVHARLDREAPDVLRVPSGRVVRLDYAADGSVSAAIKLQELFGLAETPRVGPGQRPVQLQLLAPNGRPVQVTQDLRSFWNRTYPEVRRELRGRYPRHPWPEDPWHATPTATTRRRS